MALGLEQWLSFLPQLLIRLGWATGFVHKQETGREMGGGGGTAGWLLVATQNCPCFTPKAQVQTGNEANEIGHS